MSLPDQIGAPRDLATFMAALVAWAQSFDTFMRYTQNIPNAYAGVDFTTLVGTTVNGITITSGMATEWNTVVSGLAGLPGNATIQAIASHANKIREIRN